MTFKDGEKKFLPSKVVDVCQFNRNKTFDIENCWRGIWKAKRRLIYGSLSRDSGGLR